MNVIDYKQSKKELLIIEALDEQKMLIENVKQQYKEDFKNRLTLQELKTLNELMYQKLEEKDKIDIFYEFMDKVISTALFYSFDNKKLNIDCLVDSIGVTNMYYMILTDTDLKEIKNQIQNIKIEPQILHFKK